MRLEIVVAADGASPRCAVKKCRIDRQERGVSVTSSVATQGSGAPCQSTWSFQDQSIWNPKTVILASSKAR